MKEILVQWSILILQVVIVGIALGYIKQLSCTLLARIGKYKVNGISSFIGTPIHEFGHYIMAKIFGFKVYNTKFFPTKVKDNGDGTVTLGYVSWGIKKRRITNSIGMLLVGIGPFISGTLVIVLLTYLLEPNVITIVKEGVKSISMDIGFFEYFFSISKLLIKSLISQDIINIKFLIYIILISMIAVHMTLSLPDIKTSGIGLIEVTIIIALISLIKPAIKYITYALGITSSIVSGILAICFICQIIYFIIAFIRYNLKI